MHDDEAALQASAHRLARVLCAKVAAGEMRHTDRREYAVSFWVVRESALLYHDMIAAHAASILHDEHDVHLRIVNFDNESLYIRASLASAPLALFAASVAFLKSRPPHPDAAYALLFVGVAGLAWCALVVAALRSRTPCSCTVAERPS